LKLSELGLTLVTGVACSTPEANVTLVFESDNLRFIGGVVVRS